MNYYTYILQSEQTGQFYIGQTSNISKRVLEHNSGKSKYTSKFCPWRLIWFNAFSSRSEAFQLEQQLKKYKSRERVIRYMLENPCVPGSENIQIYDLINFRESTRL